MPNIFLEARKSPICQTAPFCFAGVKLCDYGALIFSKTEYNELVKENQQVKPLFKKIINGHDLLNNEYRYILWLDKADKNLIDSCQTIKNRIAKLRELRLNSKKKSTKAQADNYICRDRFSKFNTNFIAIPRATSVNRQYLPITFLNNDIVPTSMFCIFNANYFHFGILQSHIHMIWAQKTCGHVFNDYSYSNTLVYNNFVWPQKVSETDKINISKTGYKILELQKKYAALPLKWLYEKETMPSDFKMALLNNDIAVSKAYNLEPKSSDIEIFKKLSKRLTSIMDRKK